MKSPNFYLSFFSRRPLEMSLFLSIAELWQASLAQLDTTNEKPMNSSNDLFQKPLAMTFAFIACSFLADSLIDNFV